MNPDGSGQRNLTRNPARDSNPAWSPSGRIAFVSDRAGSNSDIYIMNTDGTGLVRVTRHTALDWNPSWSPDGRKLAFASYRTGGGEIAVMNADGTGKRTITGGSGNAPDWQRRPQ